MTGEFWSRMLLTVLVVPLLLIFWVVMGPAFFMAGLSAAGDGPGIILIWVIGGIFLVLLTFGTLVTIWNQIEWTLEVWRHE